MTILFILSIVITLGNAGRSTPPSNRHNPQIEVDQDCRGALDSPDRNWRVKCNQPTVQRDAIYLTVESKSNDRHWLLTTVFRSGLIGWSKDSTIVLFLDRHSVEDTRFRAFRVSTSGPREISGLDSRIKKEVNLFLRPRKQEILYLDITNPVFLDQTAVVGADISVRSVPAGVSNTPSQEWHGKLVVSMEPVGAKIEDWKKCERDSC